MSPLLYLDTARFGLMVPRVKQTIATLNRLISTEGLSSRFETLLYLGFQAWPTAWQNRYPALADWHGVTELKTSLCQRIDPRSEWPVYLSLRSANLMKLAARLLFQRCTKVLVTDLEWPGYVNILNQECQRVRGKIVEVRVRNAALRGDISAEDLCRMVSRQYRRQQANGLFLSVVSHHGVRFPVTAILRELEGGQTRPDFTVLDSAQAFGHIPHDFELENCDLLLAGCHKWLRSHHPLGFAVSIRHRSHNFVRLVMQNIAKKWDADDPLLSLTAQPKDVSHSGSSETIDLSGVFCARAALTHNTSASEATRFGILMANGHDLEQATKETPWQPLLPHPTLRSGITLLRAHDPTIARLPPGFVRERFFRHGVALTTYDQGLLRVSSPETPILADESDQFRAALTS